METRARVIECGDGIALVEAERQSGCGNCDPVRGCGKSSMSKLFCSKPRRFEVIDPIGTKAGDEVSIGIREGALLRGSIAVYLVPMMTLVAGALLGNGWGERVSILGGAIGLVLGFLWARHYSAVNRGNTRFQPFIVKRFY